MRATPPVERQNFRTRTSRTRPKYCSGLFQHNRRGSDAGGADSSHVVADSVPALLARRLGRERVPLAAFEQAQADHRKRQVRRTIAANIRQIGAAMVAVFLRLARGVVRLVGAAADEDIEQRRKRRATLSSLPSSLP